LGSGDEFWAGLQPSFSEDRLASAETALPATFLGRAWAHRRLARL
jgi:hypothetical protein